MGHRGTWVVFVAFLGVLGLGTDDAVGQDNAANQQITPEVIRKVKQATAYLKVTGERGEAREGTGFLAEGPGVLITNAHVLGMLSAGSKPPARIDVTFRSGETDELVVEGKLLGADRGNDLAVLQVEGKLPAPLPLGLKDELFETQKVYIFGFPFGTELGRNITVSESSISSLRKDAQGALERIQVNGGMNPGNSGGPVVDSQGRVVGVSVAMIRTTQINFAIPAAIAKSMLDGRILDVTAGVPFREKNEVRIPLSYVCVDPFQRIRHVRVDVWAGKPATDRPYSSTQVQTQPGDSPRKSIDLKYEHGVAVADVAPPKLADGEAAWFQPVATDADGKSQWGAPRAFDVASPVDRIPASLTINLTGEKERSVRLKIVEFVQFSSPKDQSTSEDGVELDLLEVLSPEPRGAAVRTGFALPQLTRIVDQAQKPVSPSVPGLLQQMAPSYVIDETNKLQSFAGKILNPKIPTDVRTRSEDYFVEISLAYQAANFIMPNRELRPGDSWQVQLPLMFKTEAGAETVDLVVDCRYEGQRLDEGRSDALVLFDGRLQGRGARKDTTGGVAKGRLTFDVGRGFISTVKMTIMTEAVVSGTIHVLRLFSFELARSAGNPQKLQLPNVTPTPPATAQAPPRTPDSPANRPGSLANRPGGMTNKPGARTNRPSAMANRPGARPSRPGVPAAQPGVPVAKSESPVASEEFVKPAESKTPSSYMKVVSSPGDYIGQGKTYDYTGDQLVIKKTARGVRITVDGWSVDIGSGKGEAFAVGEYQGAKRFAFSGESPGLDFSGNGRGSNMLTGAFAVWEYEVTGDKVVRLAIDFTQRSDGKPPLNGKIRFNSAFE